VTASIHAAKQRLPLQDGAALSFNRPSDDWRLAQYLVLLAGFALVASLFLRPALGLDLLWNGLIPLAPLLLVVAPGVWRNICPLATFSLLPQRLGRGRGHPLPRPLAGRLSWLGLLALLLIVPLRHVCLDRHAGATALMLLAAAAAAFLGGWLYAARSAWCNSLCPIHPAEKLYGQMPAWTPANARCDSCGKCSRPCPDSTRAMNPTVTASSSLERWSGHVMAGGFAGFVWGWHQVGDMLGPVTVADVVLAYAWPFGGGLLSLASYALAWRYAGKTPEARRRLLRGYAWAAVTLYYWFRIPALMGFGEHPGTGMLVDWTVYGDWPAWLARATSSAFLSWFMLLRGTVAASWLQRPAVTELSDEMPVGGKEA